MECASACITLLTAESISSAVRFGASREDVTCGCNFPTPMGKSHSCVTATSLSPAPTKQQISVALGSKETMRCAGYGMTSYAKRDLARTNKAALRTQLISPAMQARSTRSIAQDLDAHPRFSMTVMTYNRPKDLHLFFFLLHLFQFIQGKTQNA
jgi:hypothetical protein